MGQKVSPIGMRLGVNRTWDSRWYADVGYGDLLQEDLKIRKYLLKRLDQAGVSRVVIERPAKNARITIHTARPGVVIGKHLKESPGFFDGQFICSFLDFAGLMC